MSDGNGYRGFLHDPGRGSSPPTPDPRPDPLDAADGPSRVQRPSAASVPPSIDHLARSIAAALARTLRAYLPVETRSVEARLDALGERIDEVDARVKRLGESLAHSVEDAT